MYFTDQIRSRTGLARGKGDAKGDYHTALDNLRDFVLSDDVMYKLFPQLVDRAEPGLDLLGKLAD